MAIGFAAIFSNKVISLLNEKTEINIALSGGNTPIELFKILAEEYKNKIEWNKINFYWVDERCVQPDSPESNFGNAEKFLFSMVDINRNNIHEIRGETGPAIEAERYSEWVKQNVSPVNGLPSFDIILLGVGEDGHTASIFPDQMDLLTSNKLYDVSIHPISKQSRITMTGKLINNSKNIYFLVSGKGKSGVVNDILNGNEKAMQYPANYIKAENGELFWMVDKESTNLKNFIG
ncbi:MAG: 6-phosphogluconolactonase [Ignavibacteria bacterium]|nr:6-phosphogluconolactonase [Ignavibacteria bacterium]